MSDLFPIIRVVIIAFVKIADGLMGIFSIFHELDRHVSKNSTLGQSPLSRENQDWRQWLMDTWHWISLGLLVLIAMISAVVYSTK